MNGRTPVLIALPANSALVAGRKLSGKDLETAHQLPAAELSGDCRRQVCLSSVGVSAAARSALR